MLKRHLERSSPRNTLFGIQPALCGRKRKGDYRMFPPNDAIRERANTFFAETIRGVTCKTCRRLHGRS